jgi:dodecin
MTVVRSRFSGARRHRSTTMPGDPPAAVIGGGERRHRELLTKEGILSMQEDHVYKKLDLVGSSSESIEDAIRTAVRRASKTMRNLDWFEMTEVRGWIKDGEVKHFQVGLRVGFRLED